MKVEGNVSAYQIENGINEWVDWRRSKVVHIEVQMQFQ